MIPRRIDTSRIDPNGAAASDDGLYGIAIDEADASVVVLPVPWEATTSYGGGAADGPELIRVASQQVDLYDAELGDAGLARPWEYGIHLATPPAEIVELAARARERAQPVIARGGDVAGIPDLQAAVDDVNAMSERLHEWLGGEVARLLDAGKLVATLGGDHSVSFGAIAAHAERHPGMGILHIDAHSDLRQAYEGFTHSHASIMYNVMTSVAGVAELTQVGIRDLCDEEIERIDLDPRILCFYGHDLRARRFEGETWQSIAESVVMTLPDSVYVSFDIDGLDPSLCPNTGTPVPGGLYFDEVTYLLRCLHRMGKHVVGLDLTEVAGPADGSSEWDGNVASRLLYKMIGVALLSNGARGGSPPR